MKCGGVKAQLIDIALQGFPLPFFPSRTRAQRERLMSYGNRCLPCRAVLQFIKIQQARGMNNLFPTQSRIESTDNCFEGQVISAQGPWSMGS